MIDPSSQFYFIVIVIIIIISFFSSPFPFFFCSFVCSFFFLSLFNNLYFSWRDLLVSPSPKGKTSRLLSNVDRFARFITRYRDNDNDIQKRCHLIHTDLGQWDNRPREIAFIALALGQCNFTHLYDRSNELLLVDCLLLYKKILSFIRNEVTDATRTPLISKGNKREEESIRKRRSPARGRIGETRVALFKKRIKKERKKYI